MIFAFLSLSSAISHANGPQEINEKDVLILNQPKTVFCHFQSDDMIITKVSKITRVSNQSMIRYELFVGEDLIASCSGFSIKQR